MVITFTDRKIASLPIPTPPQRQVEYWDRGLPGFGICVGYGGRKTFILRYRLNRKLRRMKIGAYPHMTLVKARKAAKIHLGQVADGDDPAQEKAILRSTPTFEDLAKDYLEMAEKKHRSATEETRIIEKDLKPALGSRLVTEIRRQDIRQLVERIATDRKAPVMANRTLGLLSRMFNFALDREWVDASPVARIQPPGTEQSRERVLTDDEIRTAWSALDSLRNVSEPARKEAEENDGTSRPPISPATASAFQVQLLTAQRPGEVRAMRWQDVDLESGWWTIPAKYSKNGQPHRVPLTESAVTLLKDRQAIDPGAEWVFENRPGQGPIVHRGKKAASALSRTLKVEFRAHDLRRTAATIMASARVSRAHIARVLNHIEGGPAATCVYDRYEYTSEKRAALEVLESRLIAIITAKNGKVLPFQAR